MEATMLSAIAVFLAPYLQKAGEKISERTVETLFDSRKDIAEKFLALFDTEIISLGLSDSASTAEITSRLEAEPKVKENVGRKIADKQDLLKELADAFKQLPQAGAATITINAEKIAQVNINPHSVSQTIDNF
jgi:hypothetical protein